MPQREGSPSISGLHSHRESGLLRAPLSLVIDPASPGPLTQVLGDHAPFGFLATQGTTKDAFSQSISPSSWACVFTTQFIRYKELYFCVCVSFSKS